MPPGLTRLRQVNGAAPRPDHSQASKREMAADAAGVMSRIGRQRYAVVGHDRGSYVAFRLAMDYPDHVTHLVAFDCVPIGEALRRADARFAPAWWHCYMSDLYGDLIEIWKPWAADVRGREIDSGNHLAEDNPTAVAAAIIEHCRLPTSPPTGSAQICD